MTADAVDAYENARRQGDIDAACSFAGTAALAFQAVKDEGGCVHLARDRTEDVRGMTSQSNYPTTIDAAVRILMGLVPADEQTRIAAMAYADLSALHPSLGQWIRNYFGLWNDNPALLLANGELEPDAASGVIIKAFWQRLRDEQPKLH